VTPEQWSEIQRQLDVALSLTVAERRTFLESIGAKDVELRRELESLLSGETADPDFMNVPALSLLHDSLESDTVTSGLTESGSVSNSMLGRVLGAYRVTGRLGVGGMGEVYLAVRADGHYDQQVAVKIVRPGLGGGEFSSIRFRNERQILAKLDHPNIAKILDGGTTEDGLPYFVMEFIDGVPITEYCDRNRLSIEGRFRLFRSVCSAVHYAHQHLVVHRDIKPTNILVTRQGTPKLLDFGIAKMLSPDSPAENSTVTGVWAMTPEYASPEQLQGQPITTATDVYSLGLILYELLTGQRAHRFSGRMPHEIARVVLESEPDKPSSAVFRKNAGPDNLPEKPDKGLNPGPIPSAACDLRGFSSARKLHRRLAGDADSMVLKALRKEARGRYASADQLSEDIRRHLEGRPITAGKGTTAYRFRKYILRHKAGVASAALVLFSLVTGVVLTWREARIARQNELRAERNLRQARELTSSLIGELPTALGESPTQAKALMNVKAVEYLKQIIEEESGNPELSFDLALAHFQLAESLGHPARANMGDPVRARENYQRAIDLFEQQLKVNPGNVKARYYLSFSYMDYGLAILWTDVSTALEMQKKALAVLTADEQIADFSQTSQKQEGQSATAQQHFSDPYFPNADLALGLQRQQAYQLIAEQYGDPYFPNLGNTSQALETMQKALELAEAVNTRYSDAHATQQLYYCNIQMAAILWARGRNKEAMEFQKRGEIVLDSMSVNGIVGVRAPQSQQLRMELPDTLVRRAGLLLDAGQLDEAQAALRESRQMLESLFWTDSLNDRLRRELTRNYNMTADTLMRTGNLEDSLDFYHKAQALAAKALAVQPDLPYERQQYADSYEGLGNALLQMSKNASALDNCKKALAIRQSLAKLDANNALYSLFLAKNYMSLTRILARTRDGAGAISNLHSALEIQESLAAKDPANALVARDLATTRRQLRDLSQK
jgi:eukaryotic-like serine/threonine-protein kinase